ncbi:Rha family transcriptional regulator [Streptococcus agalactiae]|uniref:Rha family transcriptional regulator n=2 Tax=Lactobacillales TaxID=186826 RepID=UPI0035233CE6
MTMKELIPKDEFGIFADSHDTARVDSLFVAEFFERNHAHVLREIAKITESTSGLSEEFIRFNYERSTYKDKTGRKLPRYFMTRDGFMMLIMGFKGPKAMKFKELYIKRFNEMEATIKHLVTLRMEYPLLTENITLLHDNPKPHHYSNEANMLNKIVTGMTAKEYKLKHDIPKEESSIRPFLTDKEREQLDILQRIDTGLLLSVPDYHERKQKLEWYYMKKFKED